MLMYQEDWKNEVTGLAKVRLTNHEMLHLLWDTTPITTESTQADLALIANHLSALLMHYSKKREVTALEQVKGRRE